MRIAEITLRVRYDETTQDHPSLWSWHLPMDRIDPADIEVIDVGITRQEDT